MKCPNCKREVSPEWRFCKNCGTEIPKPYKGNELNFKNGQNLPPKGDPNKKNNKLLIALIALAVVIIAVIIAFLARTFLKSGSGSSNPGQKAATEKTEKQVQDTSKSENGDIFYSDDDSDSVDENPDYTYSDSEDEDSDDDNSNVSDDSIENYMSEVNSMMDDYEGDDDIECHQIRDGLKAFYKDGHLVEIMADPDDSSWVTRYFYYDENGNLVFFQRSSDEDSSRSNYYIRDGECVAREEYDANGKDTGIYYGDEASDKGVGYMWQWESDFKDEINQYEN